MKKVVVMVLVGAGLVVALLVGILVLMGGKPAAEQEPLEAQPEVAVAQPSTVPEEPPVTIPEEPPPVVLDPHTDIMERLSREELREHLADELVLYVCQVPDYDFPPRQAALRQRFTQVALLLDTDNRLALLTKASLLRGVELKPEKQPTLNQAQLAHALGWLALELSASTESAEQILAQILGHLVLEYFNAEQEHALMAFAAFTDFDEWTSLPVLLGKAYNSAVPNPHFKDAPAVDPLWSEPEGSAFFLLGGMSLPQLPALVEGAYFQSAYSPDEPERFRNQLSTPMKDGLVRAGLPTVDRFGNPRGAIRFYHRGYVALPRMVGWNPPELTIAMWFRTQPLDPYWRVVDMETLAIDGMDTYDPDAYTEMPPDTPLDDKLTFIWWSADYEGVTLAGYKPQGMVRIKAKDRKPYRQHLRAAEGEEKILVPNRWYFIVYTRSVSEAALYIDGEQIAHKEKMWDEFTSEEEDFHLRLACSYTMGRSGEAFMIDGSIDDFYLYDRVLSPHEIKLLMAVGE